MALVEFIEKGLVKNNELDNSLGNRSTYVGASDIGGCLRKSYLDKVNPQDKDAKTLAVLLRGHLAEDLVIKALEAQGIPYRTQVELQEEFIKAHLDFVFLSKKECVVVEVKSTNGIPETPYSSWILQIQLQMYLAQKHYGLNTRGYVFVINLNTGEMKEFAIEPDETLQKLALERAKNLWKALQSGTEPEAEEQLYCSSCPHRKNCPVYNKGTINQDVLLSEVEKIMKLENQLKEIQSQLKTKKEDIKKYLEEKNISKAKVGDYQITITKSSSYKALDTSKLKKENEALYQELLSKYGKEVKRASSIRIK